MQSIQVISDDGKSTRVSFKSLILKRCEEQFQEDRDRRKVVVNKLNEKNSCNDPVINL